MKIKKPEYFITCLIGGVVGVAAGNFIFHNNPEPKPETQYICDSEAREMIDRRMIPCAKIKGLGECYQTYAKIYCNRK